MTMTCCLHDLYKQYVGMLTRAEPALLQRRAVQQCGSAVNRSLERRCYSVARGLTEHAPGAVSAYAEGFVAVEGLPTPVGHAWVVRPGGLHVDPVRADPDGDTADRDVYFGVVVDAAAFRRRMADPRFAREFERHDMLPYLRACAALGVPDAEAGLR